MKLYLIGDAVFYPINDQYLLFVCTKEELVEMTEDELKALVQQALNNTMGCTTVH